MKTVRIRFSKTGRVKYISHLDLNRAVIRALRRAAVPLWYTEGFNRHPYVTFAAPLSLGYESLCESMDIRLEEEMPMEELVRRLNAVMPEGLHVLSADKAHMKPGELEAARYRLTFGCPAKAVEDLLARDSLLVEKRTKKKTMKTIDIRPALRDTRVEEAGETCVLEVTLPCGATDTVNPSLLLTALQEAAGDPSIPCRVLRIALYGRNGADFA